MTSADPFDAYYAWLGIPPDEQPAHHYRLLDVPALETNLAAIDIGYQRRMMFLKSLKTGRREAALDRIKQELTDAWNELLNSTKKQRYDATLRARSSAPQVDHATSPSAPTAGSSAFDPYLIWLGIPPDEQPAHHYRLLDVAAYESSHEIIEHGFNRRMTYLRTIKDGAHVEAAEKLKDELTTARLCLLNNDKRSHYDATLRARLGVEPAKEIVESNVYVAMPVPEPVPIATPVPPLIPDAALLQADVPTAEIDVEPIRYAWPLTVGLAACATLLLGGIWYVAGGRHEELANHEPTEAEPATITLPPAEPAPPKPAATPRRTPNPAASATALSTPDGTSAPRIAASAYALPTPSPSPSAASTGVTRRATQLAPLQRSLLPGTASPPATASTSPLPAPSVPAPTVTTSPSADKPPEYALEFTAPKGSRLVVGAPAIQFDGRTPMTIEFWYSHTERIETQELDCLICGFSYSIDRNGSRPYLAFRLTKSSNERFLSLRGFETQRTDFDYPTLIQSTPVELTRRHHLALVYVPDARSSLFVDGIQRTQTIISLPLLPTNFIIGGPGFNGIIDELRVSRSTRYSANFTPRNRFDPDGDTVALFHFDEGSGRQLLDSSGGRHHARAIPGVMRWTPVAPPTEPEPNTPATIAARPAIPMPARATSPARGTTSQILWSQRVGRPVSTTTMNGPTMTLIPPGGFLMGSSEDQIGAAMAFDKDTPNGTEARLRETEMPQHRVVLTRPLLLARSETTVAQFRDFVGATNYVTDAERFGFGDSDATVAGLFTTDAAKRKNWRTPGHDTVDDAAVTQVTWNDAVAYCNWRSSVENLTPCYSASSDGTWTLVPNAAGYRLPTEAEWEHACRAETSTPFSFGDAPTDDYLSSKRGFPLGAPRTGTKLPNRFGLVDMHGGVGEWCQDRYEASYYAQSPAKDPPGSATGSNRITRGGGRAGSIIDCRSAARVDRPPTTRSDDLGFRIARDCPQRISR